MPFASVDNATLLRLVGVAVGESFEMCNGENKRIEPKQIARAARRLIELTLDSNETHEQQAAEHIF